MIQYFHERQGQPPPWLRGSPSLATRRYRTHFLYGIGDGFLLTPPPEDAVQLEDGWKCWLNGDGAQPDTLYRFRPALTVDTATDMHAHCWACPIIVLPTGKRAFKVAFGRDWKPALTERQQTLLNYADEAAQFLAESEGSGEIEGHEKACAWAANFLEESNYLTTEVIEKLQLMDGILMLSSLHVATGRTLQAPMAPYAPQ